MLFGIEILCLDDALVCYMMLLVYHQCKRYSTSAVLTYLLSFGNIPRTIRSYFIHPFSAAVSLAL